ncbi:MAG: type VI secretion system baseplate subunit TssG [Ectothiorhodospiraceae bacterium]|nr:type VI secretion system baseplate subunit TssG [Ectothiorhodospiraceae bacterium]
MPTKNRRKNVPVIKQLSQSPYDYDFIQAVRLVERSAVFDKTHDNPSPHRPIAKYIPPIAEFIRFTANSSLSFPSADIDALHKGTKGTRNNQWTMNVNFIGLTGSAGILPYHYTEMTLQRLKLKDSAMANFFNMFNHRTVSLFYQASCKYNLPLQYESSRLTHQKNNGTDNSTRALLSLIGFGTNNLTNRQYTKDESLIYYAGLFTEKMRTASGLQQILQHHFSIPVDIKEFIGQWQDLIVDMKTRMASGNAGSNHCLGKTVMLGGRGWFAQGKIQIILGPLSKKQVEKFSPGTNTLKALDEMVRLYLGFEHDYEFIMKIRKIDIPDKPSFAKDNTAILGWNMWLSSKNASSHDPDDIVFIPVSYKR